MATSIDTDREEKRLSVLGSYGILDTGNDPDVNDLTVAAAALCQAPIALVSLVAHDRQWFKARIGTTLQETPIAQSICAFVVRGNAPLVINDLTHDARTCDNTLVTASPHIRFYAGFPLRAPTGEVLGSLCVIDVKVRPEGLSDAEALALDALARQVMRLLDGRRHTRRLAERGADASRRAAELEVAHRALSENHATHQSAGAAGGIGTFELDFATERMTVSPQMCHIFGLPIAPHHPLEAFLQLIEPRHRERLPSVAILASGKGPTKISYRIHRASDGAERWIVRRGNSEPNAQGEFTRMVGTVQDVTRDHEATDRLNVLMSIGDQLQDAPDRRAAIGIVAAHLGDTLRVDRVVFLSHRLDKTKFNVENSWTGPDVPPLPKDCSFSDFPISNQFLSRGLVLAFNDIDTVGWLASERDAYLAIDTRATLGMPLIKHDILHGVLFLQSMEPRQWTEGETNFVRAVTERLDIAFASLHARDQQQTINEEISHRLKNTLMLVQALAHQSLRHIADREAVKAFGSRLIALSSAHDLLVKKNWQCGDLYTLAKGVLAKLGHDVRITLSGPEIALGPNTTMTMSMILHELATNAVKFGSLSNETGTVNVRWWIEQGTSTQILRLTWSECGGPPVSQPSHQGTGTRILSRGLGGGGAFTIDFQSEGICAELWVPLIHAQCT